MQLIVQGKNSDVVVINCTA